MVWHLGRVLAVACLNGEEEGGHRKCECRRPSFIGNLETPVRDLDRIKLSASVRR